MTIVAPTKKKEPPFGFLQLQPSHQSQIWHKQSRRESNTPDTSKEQSALVGPLAAEASLFGGEGGKV